MRLTDLTMLVPVLRPMRLLAFLSVKTLAMPANPITYSLKSIVPLKVPVERFQVKVNRGKVCGESISVKRFE